MDISEPKATPLGGRHRTLTNYLASRADDRSFDRLANSSIAAGIHPLQRLRGIPSKPQQGPRLWPIGAHLEQEIGLASLLSLGDPLIYTIYNQTGILDGIAQVARDYIAAIENNAFGIPPDYETAWLFIFGGLINEIGQTEVFNSMSSFHTKIRHFADPALDTMNWISAKFTIAPYLRNETTQLPDRPENMSDNFDWESWINIAQEIRVANGELIVTSNDTETAMAAEMYYLLDDFENIIAIVERDLSPKDAAAIFQDHMKRLDLRCAAYTDYPARAIFLGGATLYRFPPNP